MKRWFLFPLICLLSTSCTTMTILSDWWEATKTGIRQAAYTGKSFVQQDPDSRLVATTSEFFSSLEGDFIPLSDQDAMAQLTSQAKEVPGLPGGKVPGIEAFKLPSKGLAATFSKLYFHTDQHIPKDKDHLSALRSMAAYLKKQGESLLGS